RRSRGGPRASRTSACDHEPDDEQDHQQEEERERKRHAEPGAARIVVERVDLGPTLPAPCRPALPQLVDAAHHFVPYRRSPASPRPGTMKPCSFRPRSIAATTTCTSGWSRVIRSIPSGAATIAISRTELAPAVLTVRIAAAVEL